MFKDLQKMWNKLNTIQRVFVVVALLTVACSVCADCLVCRELRNVATNLGLMKPTEGFSDDGSKLVLYYAPWCPHCKSLMPTWDQLKSESSGSNVSVEKVDCEANPEAAEEQGVNGFPTIVLFKNGEATTYEGDRSLDDLKKFISSN